MTVSLQACDVILLKEIRVVFLDESTHPRARHPIVHSSVMPENRHASAFCLKDMLCYNIALLE